MNTYKKNAVIIGVLFLVALFLNLIASELFKGILNQPDYLLNTYPAKSQLIFGNLLNFICAIAMIFIPIALYPVIQKDHPYMGQVYIVFRALEGILFIYMAIKTLTLISLSKVFINNENQNITHLQALADSIHFELHWATIIYVIIFCTGALAFYSLLFKSKRVPRPLSIWGLFAILWLFAGTLMGLFSLGIFNEMPFMKAMIYFAPPIALNEFVLGFWLIFKGFNPGINQSIIK
jgi:Domain of unknown function (DUF4386)